jgi:hypothetical protein
MTDKTSTAMAGIATIVLLLLTLAPSAEAQQRAYSHRPDTNCNGIADPISVIFYGTAATPRVLAGYERGGPFRRDVDGEITRHTNWRRHNSDNLFRQDAPTRQGCTRNPGDTDLASASGYGNDRWHLRMWPVNLNRTSNENFFTQTTPHREDWYFGDGVDNRNDCGTGPGTGSHAVERGAVDRGPRHYERNGSGFDRARRFLDRAYRDSRHYTERQYFGNTRSVLQCDGEYAGSNGQGLFVLIGRDATR